MMKSADWIKRLKYLAFNRVTYYDNQYPSNCGEINPDGSISFDCINMVKSVLNEPDIVYKTSPAGYYVKPGQVIPDVDGAGILALCTGVKWYDFSTISPGEFIYMRTDGHGGVFVGEFTSGGYTFNVIECTAAWKSGVVASYLDPKTGGRFSCKGGSQIYAWEAHGKLTPYIDYTKSPEKVVVDGIWGKETTKLAQKVYGCKTVSGVIKHQKKSYKKVCPACDKSSWKFDGTDGYSPLIAKIQKELKLGFGKTHPSYGKFTKKTRRHLQKKIGVVVTGTFDAQSVRAFQRYINKKAKAK